MHAHQPALDRDAAAPALHVADIIRTFGAECRRRHVLSAEQLRVLGHIRLCHTPALGGHVELCEACGFERMVFNGCRDRHCPSCQSLAQARWIEQRTATVLPTGHFHVVFTLPDPLRPLVAHHRKLMFDLLFETASATLLELGRDPHWLGAQLGITAVLHTWTRELLVHPHLHCVVSGGGLCCAASSWVPLKDPHFLFPVHVIGALFRGKFLDALRQARTRGLLRLEGVCQHLADPDAFDRFTAALQQTSWVVFSQAPVDGPSHIFNYLGRYIHRVAISDQRLLHVDSQAVTFLTKDGNTCTLDGAEFVYRFLQHVLPPRFVKIRHYGLYASGNVRTRLATARCLLQQSNGPDPQLAIVPTPVAPVETTGALQGIVAPPAAAAVAAPSPPSSIEPTAQTPAWQTHLEQLTGLDLSRCPRCRKPGLRRLPLPQPKLRADRCRSPPPALRPAAA